MDYSITLERKNISSKHKFLPHMHNEYSHARLQQPAYPSYALPPPLFPSYLDSSTLYVIQTFPLFLFHSFQTPSTPTYLAMEIIIPCGILLNKVDQTTYDDDI